MRLRLRPAIKSYFILFTVYGEYYIVPILLSPEGIIGPDDLEYLMNTVWPEFSRLDGVTHVRDFYGSTYLGKQTTSADRE
jgi:hypothetical protein